jgi:hypothetical protein
LGHDPVRGSLGNEPISNLGESLEVCCVQTNVVDPTPLDSGVKHVDVELFENITVPTPIVAGHLTPKAAEQIYGPGLTFQIGLVTMCTDTGTYLDVPFHRYADGHDLAKLDLARVASVDAIPITGAQTPTSRITQRWQHSRCERS